MKNIEYSKYISWKMLGWLFAIQLLIALVARSLAPLGIIIGDDLQLTKSQIGMFPAALFLGQSLISIPAGLLTDKIGSRKMIFFIVLLLGCSFLIISISTSFILLLFLISIAGFAYGASHPATNRGILLWFSVKTRGTAMGLKQMGVTLGSALATIILLPIAKSLGWQSATFTAALILLVVGVLICSMYSEPRSIGYVRNTNQTKPTSRKIDFKNIIQMLKHKGLILITFSAMLLSGSQMILNTFIILFAHEKIGISLLLSGVLLVIAELGGSLGRVSWGIISDHLFRGKRIIVLLLISILVAMISLIIALLPHGTSFYNIAFIVFIFGFGTSGFNGVWMNATTEIVHPSVSGLATGFSITFGSWGVIFFPPIFGSIIDQTGEYTISWLFVTFLMVLSIISLSITLKSNGGTKIHKLD
ncbi:MFS transporter [Pseudogracilibacillus sp. SE30717A]|uniref:MFS transporter n=1 Tax=Pseudogracilibacillus sp. SE30717A TaxID=3098293 RepID=UPI00300E32E0